MGLKVTKFYPEALEAVVVTPAVGGACLTVAEKAKTIAEGFSADFTVTGHYERSFETRMEIRHLPGDKGGHAHDAMCAVLVNNADYSLDVEYGYEGRSKRMTRTAHRVLGRTAAALKGA